MISFVDQCCIGVCLGSLIALNIAQLIEIRSIVKKLEDRAKESECPSQ